MTTDTDKVARGYRDTHMLNVALAAGSGEHGALKEACDLAQIAMAEALRTAVAEAYEDAAVACEQNASASKIVAPLTNAAYDEGCRDCAEIIRSKAKLGASRVFRCVARQGRQDTQGRRHRTLRRDTGR